MQHQRAHQGHSHSHGGRARAGPYVFSGTLAYILFNFYSIFVHLYSFNLETAYLPNDGWLFGVSWLLLLVSFLRGAFTSAGKVQDGWYKKYPQTHQLLIKQYLLQQKNTAAANKDTNNGGNTNTNTNTSTNTSTSANAADVNIRMDGAAGNSSDPIREREANDERESLLSSPALTIELPSNFARPSRSHYCYELKSNILRMDHFCVWFNNAVGFYNYKFFYLTMFYLFWCTFIGIGVVVYRVFVDPMTTATATATIEMEMEMEMSAHGPDDGDGDGDGDGLKRLWRAICLFFTVASGVFFVVFSVIHLYMHSWQITKGLTSIEAQKFMQLRQTAKHFELKFPNTHGYDHGWFRNTQQMLGYDVVFWLLPTNPWQISDGYKFTINEPKKQMVTQFMAQVCQKRETLWKKKNFVAMRNK